MEKVLYAADTEEAKLAMLEAQELYGAQLVVLEGEAEGVEAAAVAAQWKINEKWVIVFSVYSPLFSYVAR